MYKYRYNSECANTQRKHKRGPTASAHKMFLKVFHRVWKTRCAKAQPPHSYATGLALASLFAYNGGMYIDAMVDCFYSVMTALVPVIVPVLVIYMVFRLVKGLLK